MGRRSRGSKREREKQTPGKQNWGGLDVLPMGIILKKWEEHFLFRAQSKWRERQTEVWWNRAWRQIRHPEEESKVKVLVVQLCLIL